jgi:hypothetical protein
LLSDVIASPHSALEHLAIVDCCINEASTTTLLSGLAANSTLQHLDLSRNEITHDNATALASGLAGNETLVKLTLDGCWIDDASATAISSGLEQNTSLQVLDLTDLKNITKIGWSSLLSSVKSSKMPLKAIFLSRTYTITDAEICFFAGILIAKKDTIVEISTPCNMTRVGWNVFLAVLHTPMPNFTYLSLETSNLGDDIAIAFADCLKNQDSSRFWIYIVYLNLAIPSQMLDIRLYSLGEISEVLFC